LFGDEAVADDVLFVGDQYDDVMALGGSEFLQARLCVLKRRTICHRVDHEIRLYQITTLVCLRPAIIPWYVYS